MNPRQFLQCIYENYEVLETIIRESPSSSFSENNLRLTFQDLSSGDSGDLIFQRIHKLKTYEVIIKEPRSDNYVLNDHAQSIIQYLSKESVLETAPEIKGAVETLKKYSAKLEKAGESKSQELIVIICNDIDLMLRKIQKNLNSNQDAILGIVATAKMASGKRSLEHRYQIVLNTLEEYVEPMISMVSTNQIFSKTLSQLERRIDRLLPIPKENRVISYGTIPLQRIKSRVLDLMSRSYDSLQESNRILAPLCNDLRRNTELSRAAATILERCRKTGTKKTFQNISLPDVSKRSNAEFSISDIDIMSFGSQLKEAKAESHEVVAREAITITPDVNSIDFDALYKEIAEELPIMDVFDWLIKRFPDYSLSKIFEAYFWVRGVSENGSYKEKKEYVFDQHLIQKFAYSLTELKAE